MGLTLFASSSQNTHSLAKWCIAIWAQKKLTKASWFSNMPLNINSRKDPMLKIFFLRFLKCVRRSQTLRRTYSQAIVTKGLIGWRGLKERHKVISSVDKFLCPTLLYLFILTLLWHNILQSVYRSPPISGLLPRRLQPLFVWPFEDQRAAPNNGSSRDCWWQNRRHR